MVNTPLSIGPAGPIASSECRPGARPERGRQASKEPHRYLNFANTRKTNREARPIPQRMFTTVVVCAQGKARPLRATVVIHLRRATHAGGPREAVHVLGAGYSSGKPLEVIPGSNKRNKEVHLFIEGFLQFLVPAFEFTRSVFT